MPKTPRNPVAVRPRLCVSAPLPLPSRAPRHASASPLERKEEVRKIHWMTFGLAFGLYAAAADAGGITSVGADAAGTAAWDTAGVALDDGPTTPTLSRLLIRSAGGAPGRPTRPRAPVTPRGPMPRGAAGVAGAAGALFAAVFASCADTDSASAARAISKSSPRRRRSITSPSWASFRMRGKLRSLRLSLARPSS